MIQAGAASWRRDSHQSLTVRVMPRTAESIPEPSGGAHGVGWTMVPERGPRARAKVLGGTSGPGVKGEEAGGTAGAGRIAGGRFLLLETREPGEEARGETSSLVPPCPLSSEPERLTDFFREKKQKKI